MTHASRSLLAVALSLVACAPALAQITPGDTGRGDKLGIQSQNNSGELGSVTLFPRGPHATLVVLDLDGAPHTGLPASAQPAHIHRGKSCSTLDPTPAYPLANVVRGHSSTVVPVSEDRLLSGNYVVNIHKSLANPGLYVACGELYR